jgi:two-component system response regulator ResD
MSVKVLLADDEERMRRLVSDFLKRQAYEVVEAVDGKEAIERFNELIDNLDLVILDVMMPKYDGLYALKEIRSRSQVPVIMLTAKSQESDELLGFGLGADEYVTKPFSPIILMARIHAILKRAGLNKEIIRKYNGIEIDERAHIVKIDKCEIELTPKEFELLKYFLDNEGIALSRDTILDSVWRHDFFGDIRTVDTHIKKLRIKMGEKGDYIQTIRGLGYKFGCVG